MGSSTRASIARRRRHRRNMQLQNRQGPMFPGNKVAASARDTILQTIMDDIDSKEVRGRLPSGTIKRVVDANQVIYPWLMRYQIQPQPQLLPSQSPSKLFTTTQQQQQ